MAKYEREFLVPYLMNLCALQLAYRKLSEREFVLSGQVGRLRNGLRPANEPKKPWIEPLPPGGIFLSVMAGITVLMAFLMYGLGIDFLGGFFIFGGILEGVLGYMLIRNVKNSNEEKQYEYQRKLKEYNEIRYKNEKDRQSNLPAALDELRKCQLEKKSVVTTMNQVYAINVIPMQYRSLYASVFLYHWFSSSRADDLEMALNMFVLEEIKEKLDRIIENQSNMILNQQIMLANQQKTLEQQREYSEMMQNKLDRIEASNEDRNMYLRMIESNTATTAYFAVADYIRRI